MKKITDHDKLLRIMLELNNRLREVGLNRFTLDINQGCIIILTSYEDTYSMRALDDANFSDVRELSYYRYNVNEYVTVRVLSLFEEGYLTIDEINSIDFKNGFAFQYKSLMSELGNDEVDTDRVKELVKEISNIEYGFATIDISSFYPVSNIYWNKYYVPTNF